MEENGIKLFEHSASFGPEATEDIAVYNNQIICTIFNWVDCRVETSWECTHQLFYDSNKNDEKFKPVIEFLIKENMIDTIQK